MLDRIARARAKAREHAWNLIEKTPAGFPWLAVAGKTLTGWLVAKPPGCKLPAPPCSRPDDAAWCVC